MLKFSESMFVLSFVVSILTACNRGGGGPDILPPPASLGYSIEMGVSHPFYTVGEQVRGTISIQNLSNVAAYGVVNESCFAPFYIFPCTPEVCDLGSSACFTFPEVELTPILLNSENGISNEIFFPVPTLGGSTHEKFSLLSMPSFYGPYAELIPDGTIFHPQSRLPNASIDFVVLHDQPSLVCDEASKSSPSPFFSIKMQLNKPIYHSGERVSVKIAETNQSSCEIERMIEGCAWRLTLFRYGSGEVFVPLEPCPSGEFVEHFPVDSSLERNFEFTLVDSNGEPLESGFYSVGAELNYDHIIPLTASMDGGPTQKIGWMSSYLELPIQILE